MARTPHHLAAVALGVALLWSTACSGDAETTDPPASSVTAPRSSTTHGSTTTEDGSTSSSTTAPDSVEAQVEAAYIEAIRAYYVRLQNPDPDDPALRDTASGAILQHSIDRNAQMKAQGERIRFTQRGVPIPIGVEVTIQSSTQAQVVSCLVNDVVRFNVDGVVDDSVHSVRYQSSMTLIEGRWKLSDQSVLTSWDDDLGCER